MKLLHAQAESVGVTMRHNTPFNGHSARLVARDCTTMPNNGENRGMPVQGENLTCI